MAYRVIHESATAYWPDNHYTDDEDTDMDSWLRRTLSTYEDRGWELCGTIYRPRVPGPTENSSLVCEKLTLIFKKPAQY